MKLKTSTYELNMKNLNIISFLAVYVCILTQTLEANDCECYSSWKTYAIGRRQEGDQLLFRDIKSSNWTIELPVHTFLFEYSNTNITKWELGMAPV